MVAIVPADYCPWNLDVYAFEIIHREFRTAALRRLLQQGFKFRLRNVRRNDIAT